MTTDELLEYIRDVLAADAAIAAWCQTNFSKKPTIYTGIDENKPPPESEYPVIAVVEIKQLYGETHNKKSWDIIIGCGVVQEEIVVDEIAKTKTFSGFIQAEQLRNLVQEALAKANFAKISYRGESGQISGYPMFVSYTIPTIELWNKRRR
jgi:hypothetical protein